jgi:hypothetical protein
LIVCAILVGCSEKDTSPVIARVGRSVLTLNNLYQRIPPEYSDKISREQMISYARQWMDAELLYQEALRQKINKEKIIHDRIIRMEKDLLSAEVLQRNLPSSGPGISEDAISEYFEKNKQMFTRDADVVKILDMIVPDAKTAWTVRNVLAASPESFAAVAAKYSVVPLPEPADAPLVTLTSLLPAVAAVVSTIKVGGTTSPVEAEDGVHIIRVLDKQFKGSTSTLDEVRDEIVSALSAERQKGQLDNYLVKLKLTMNQEFNADRIPGTNAANSAGN